jgi:hypothetical protein
MEIKTLVTFLHTDKSSVNFIIRDATSARLVITLPHSGRLGGLEQPKGLPVASKVRIHRIHWNLAHRAVVGSGCIL